jgi:hypothetical protein
VQVLGNKIHENARANISISKKGDPLIKGNDVWGGSQSGIFIYGPLTLTLTQTLTLTPTLTLTLTLPLTVLGQIFSSTDRSCGILIYGPLL